MANAIKFAKLDYMTIKPYMNWKTLMLVLGVAIILSFTMDTSGVIAVLVMYAVLFASYPFSVGEQSGIDTLYATLAIDRKTVVAGRYLFAFSLTLGMGIIGFVISYVASIILKTEVAGNIVLPLAILGACLALFGIMQAIQLPVYFKLGYQKGKFAAYIPVLAVPIAVIGLTWLSKNQAVAGLLSWVENNMVLVIILAVAIYLIGLAASMMISVRFYKKRDF